MTTLGAELTEEPGGKRRALRAYHLRYDRLAAYLSGAFAFVWTLVLLRNWIFPIDANGIFPVETSLRTLTANIPGALAIAFGVALIAVDSGLAYALYNGTPRARFFAKARAWIGVLAAGGYFAATHDFGTAFGLGLAQGLIIMLLAQNAGLLLIYPSLTWLGVFFVLPLVSVLAYSLGHGTAIGTVDLSNLSFENYARILQPVGASGLLYINIIVRTIWVAFLTTVLCLLIGYPFAFWMARQPQRRRDALMMLVMIPFWTNLLVRTAAWVIILRNDGILNGFLVNFLHITDKPLEMVNTPGALMLGMVYGYLPYMILPLFTTIERLDPKMVEAANDLYANPWNAFRRVIWPLTLPGIVAGSILVFIPSVGTYVVSSLLGGGRYYLIGNLLEQQFIGSTGNKAFGAAFGVILTVMMLITTLVYFRLGRKGGVVIA